MWYKLEKVALTLTSSVDLLSLHPYLNKYLSGLSPGTTQALLGSSKIWIYFYEANGLSSFFSKRSRNPSDSCSCYWCLRCMLGWYAVSTSKSTSTPTVVVNQSCTPKVSHSLQDRWQRKEVVDCECREMEGKRAGEIECGREGWQERGRAGEIKGSRESDRRLESGRAGEIECGRDWWQERRRARRIKGSGYRTQ